MQNNSIKKSILFVLLSLPFTHLVYLFFYGNLANPVEYVTHGTGEWALRILLLTLAITPLRKITGLVTLVSYRRMLGLFSFFYVLIHFLIYALLDVTLNADANWHEVLQYLQKDLLERPYITIGFFAFILLIPLAITSTYKMQRRLGKNWKRLHRLVYIIAIMAIIHFFWLVKKDLDEPIIYSLILAVLFLLRTDFMSKLIQAKSSVSNLDYKK